MDFLSYSDFEQPTEQLEQDLAKYEAWLKLSFKENNIRAILLNNVVTLKLLLKKFEDFNECAKLLDEAL